MKNQTSITDRIVREPERRQITGICRTKCHLMEKEGKFPARRKLGGRAVGWMLSEIQEWLQNQPKVISNKAA